MTRRAQAVRLTALSGLCLSLLLAARAACAAVTCTVAATGVVFGNYASPGSANGDGSGNVAVTCTAALIASNAAYNIALGAGSGSFAGRTLNSGANALAYNLYLDSTRAAIWGDGSAGTQTVGDSYLVLLLPTTRNYTVYGRIPGGQNRPAGAYADTVTVSVRF